MTVDFHVHSTASDGTLTPSEIAAAAGGFAAVALTDHDEVSGLAGWRGVAGVELSVEPGPGFDTFHLLGLGFDPGDAALSAFLEGVRRDRNARNERMLANFAALGVEIPENELSAFASGRVLARPHFSAWLVAHGFAADGDDAFRRYLTPGAPDATRCYEERRRPTQDEAFKVIHGAGGICVMAHPKYWRRAWKTSGADFAVAGRGLAELKERGLDGLEALYQANAPLDNLEFTRIADSLGLLKTAGSDFHGGAKKGIRLGMEVSEAFISPLLERLGMHPAAPGGGER